MECVLRMPNNTEIVIREREVRIERSSQGAVLILGDSSKLEQAKEELDRTT
jgi:hypothetical protein